MAVTALLKEMFFFVRNSKSKLFSHLMLIGTLAIVGSLVLAACGDDDDDGGGDFDAVELKIGAVLAETGALGPLGVPVKKGVELAEEDINAQGGNVTVTYADSGTNPDTATESVNRLLGEGNHVIVGAMASGITQAFIQTLSDQGIAQCSPSATSPSFSTQENADFFVRTVPPDEGVSPIIADYVIDDGGTRVAIVARADDYGNALATLVAKGLDEAGADYEVFKYDPAATTFDSEVSAVVAYNPDAVVNIGFFFDGTNIIRGLIEAGISADVQYGADGLYFPELPLAVDPNNPNVLDGMKVFAASGTEDFNNRLSPLTNGNVIYGGQAYDCTVLLALAAQVAGNTNGDEIIAAIQGLTMGGEECTSYGECAGLIADGKDIRYLGAAGKLDLNAVGDPTKATYAINEWKDGSLTPIGAVEVDLTELE